MLVVDLAHALLEPPFFFTRRRTFKKMNRLGSVIYHLPQKGLVVAINKLL
jgi:hypothetical protein